MWALDLSFQTIQVILAHAGISEAHRAEDQNVHQLVRVEPIIKWTGFAAKRLWTISLTEDLLRDSGNVDDRSKYCRDLQGKRSVCSQAFWQPILT